MSIKIHGRTYETRADVARRANELASDNAKFGESDGRVTELNALLAQLDAWAEIDRKPFYVYYRTASGGKGIARFATRKGQIGFIDRTPHAVTAFN